MSKLQSQCVGNWWNSEAVWVIVRMGECEYISQIVINEELVEFDEIIIGKTGIREVEEGIL